MRIIFILLVISLFFSCNLKSTRKNTDQLTFHEKVKVYKKISDSISKNQTQINSSFHDSIKKICQIQMLKLDGQQDSILFEDLLFNKSRTKFVTCIYETNKDPESFDWILLFLGRKIKGRWYFFQNGSQPIYKPKSGIPNSLYTLRKYAYKLVLGGYVKYNSTTNKWEYNPDFFDFHFNFGVKSIVIKTENCAKINTIVYDPSLSEKEIKEKNKYKFDNVTYKSLKGTTYTEEQINEEYFYNKVQYAHYHNHGGDNTGIASRDVYKLEDYKLYYEPSKKRIKVILPVKRWHDDYPLGQYSCFDYWVDSVNRCEDGRGDIWKYQNIHYINYNDSVIVNYIPNVKLNSLFKFRMFINVFGYQDDIYFAFKMKNGKPIYQGMEDPDKVNPFKFVYKPKRKN